MPHVESWLLRFHTLWGLKTTKDVNISYLQEEKREKMAVEGTRLRLPYKRNCRFCRLKHLPPQEAAKYGTTTATVSRSRANMMQ